MHLEDPRFPPMLEGHAVKTPREPFAHACRQAQLGKLGAGDLVWSRSTQRASLAIVLEPEVALERALQMAPLIMVALGDCLGALCPPQVGVMYRWPRTILLNGVPAGEVRAGAPRVALDARPPWLVVGMDLQITAPKVRGAPDFSTTSLAEMAGPDITRTAILQSLAAHFLTWLNIWQDDGFRPVHDQWLFRAEGREAPIAVAHRGGTIEGVVLGLDEGADLLIRPAQGKVQSLAFIDAVELVEPSPAAA